MRLDIEVDPNVRIRTILRDPTLFPDPHTFNPDRYFKPSSDEAMERRRDPRAYVFGFGRR